MDESQRARFVHVYDLLTQVAEGVGRGNQALVVASKTDHGTLAVKTAEVNIEFLLTSTATSTEIKGPSIGANTLIGLSTTQLAESSRASIRLEIVPILAADEKGSEKSGSKKVTGNSERALAGEPKPADSLGGMLELIKARVEANESLQPNLRWSMTADLDRMHALFMRGSTEQATLQLREFVKKHGKAIAPEAEDAAGKPAGKKPQAGTKGKATPRPPSKG